MKRCRQCKKQVSEELFICPHCGGILGTSAYKPPAIAKAKKERKPRRKWNLAWLSTVLLFVLVISLALILPRYLKDISGPKPTQPTQSTQSSPQPVRYSVRVMSDSRKSLVGVTVEIFCGDVMVHSCQTAEYGKVSFELPQRDDYRIRLRGLPTQYQLNYQDIDFSFSHGKQELLIELENKPIDYVVTVVNADGEPLSGVILLFNSNTPNAQSVRSVTDESGRCIFEAWYQESGYRVQIRLFPTDYTSPQTVYYFEEGANQLQIVLTDIHTSIPDNRVLHTILVTDEYGQPVTDTTVLVVTDDPNAPPTDSYHVWEDGFLNLEGRFAFLGEIGQSYSIVLPELPDYSQTLLPLEDADKAHHFVLDLDREAYTYTVYVTDQEGAPMPNDVFYLICPSDPEADQACYISDENGVITFSCSEKDPTKVQLYRLDQAGATTLETYSFPYFTRNLTVVVSYLRLTYSATVVDQFGKPVSGVLLILSNQDGSTYIAYSGSDGTATFTQQYFSSLRDWQESQYFVRIGYLPEGYVGQLDLSHPFPDGQSQTTIEVTVLTDGAA